MRPRFVCLVLTLLASAAGAVDFDAYFTGRTLRFDYYHGGMATEESVSLDRIRLEGAWPGSRVHLLDPTNLGKYLFEVIDRPSNRVLYSRGFASIYGEWETIGEARQGIRRTFHESQRFPEPRRKVQLVLKKRSADGSFREIFATTVDPVSRFVDRSAPVPRGKVWTLFESGPPATKVDLLILGDGYRVEDMEKFRTDVRRLADALFSTEPFRRHRGDFNVRAIDVPATESGVTDPRSGTWLRSPLGLSYNAFDSERYILSQENRAIRDLAALAPYDALILLANSRKYGGGGIFNLWTTAASGSAQAPYLVVHEFGHSFAGLADEYYTSQVAYEDFNPTGHEPWEPNVTALLEGAELKWGDMVGDETPLPTPWDQASYDKLSLELQARRQEMRARGASEEEMEAYFDEVKASTQPILEGERYAARVGAFEGAGYQAKGLYRPAVDCIMFTRNPASFCPVCARAIEAVIGLYTE